jgi:hypothetical protein
MTNLYFYIFTGWKEQILSLPKKWLSQASDTDEYGFPDVSNHEISFENFS